MKKISKKWLSVGKKTTLVSVNQAEKHRLGGVSGFSLFLWTLGVL